MGRSPVFKEQIKIYGDIKTVTTYLHPIQICFFIFFVGFPVKEGKKVVQESAVSRIECSPSSSLGAGSLLE